MNPNATTDAKIETPKVLDVPRVFTTTTDKQYMVEVLDMHPSQVDKCEVVSLAPTSFSQDSNLGWGERWTAMHDAKHTSDQAVCSPVAGRSVMLEGHDHTFQQLMSQWEASIQARQDYLSESRGNQPKPNHTPTHQDDRAMQALHARQQAAMASPGTPQRTLGRDSGISL